MQQIDLTRLDDEDHQGQLTRLDDALILAARQGMRTPPGTRQIAVGKVIATLGMVGLITGFALFIGFIILAANDPAGGGDQGAVRPFIGWGIFAISLIIAGIGEGIRRAGMRKGI